MDRLFRNVVTAAGLAAAVQATSATPARALGLAGVGALSVGYDANLVVLDGDLRVRAVMARGAWV
jgi:N-acetylglucosamine-6-phosphate deacetylase